MRTAETLIRLGGQISNMMCVLKVTWGKSFSRVLAVFGVFNWKIYLERTDVTPFFHSQACQR